MLLEQTKSPEIERWTALPFGAPDRDLVRLASWNILQFPADEQRKTLRLPPRDCLIDQSCLAPVQRGTIDDFQYKSFSYQNIYSKYWQRLVHSEGINHPSWSYYHVSKSNAPATPTKMILLDKPRLSDPEIEKMVGLLKEGYSIEYGRGNQRMGSTIQYEARNNTLYIHSIWPNKIGRAELKETVLPENLGVKLEEWAVNLARNHPWLWFDTCPKPSTEAWKYAIENLLSCKDEFYIKPAQSSAGGRDVYRISVKKTRWKS